MRFWSLATLQGVWGLGLLACSSSGMEAGGSPGGDIEEVGTATLSLQPVGGLTIDTLSFVVTQSGVTGSIRQGILPAQGRGGTINIAFNLPPGDGYLLSVSGSSEEQDTQLVCSGSVGPFAVIAGGTVPLDLAFSCVDISNGKATNGITVKTDACPDIQLGAVSALPGEAFVRRSLALSVSAQEKNSRPLSYLWTVTDSTFASLTDQALPRATLTCLAPIAPTATKVTVFNGQCSKAAPLSFSCIAGP